MPVITAQTVSDATGQPTAVDGVAGVCERAAYKEGLALIEARRHLGALYPTVAGYEGSQDADEQDRWAQYVEAVSLLAFAIAFPQFNLRSVGKGGFVRAVGGDQNREELMSHREAEAYAAGFREQAALLLADLADALLEEQTDKADPTPIVWAV